jgi:hypothetical protein
MEVALVAAVGGLLAASSISKLLAPGPAAILLVSVRVTLAPRTAVVRAAAAIELAIAVAVVAAPASRWPWIAAPALFGAYLMVEGLVSARRDQAACGCFGSALSVPRRARLGIVGLVLAASLLGLGGGLARTAGVLPAVALAVGASAALALAVRRHDGGHIVDSPPHPVAPGALPAAAVQLLRRHARMVVLRADHVSSYDVRATIACGPDLLVLAVGGNTHLQRAIGAALASCATVVPEPHATPLARALGMREPGRLVALAWSPAQ